MPSAKKSTSVLRAAAAPVGISLTAGALEMLATGSPGLITWLVGGLAKLIGDHAAGAVEARRGSRQQAATFLTNDQLTAYTGSVLAALTEDFSQTKPAAADREALRELAKILPDWWGRLCREDDPLTGPLSGQAFVRTLADTLGKEDAAPPLQEAQILKLLTDAARDVPALPAETIKYLAAFICKQFPSALATGLTKSSATSVEAFRKSLLRFHAETITGVQSLTGEFNAFFAHYIEITDGLEAALQEVRASLGRIESTGDDTNRRVRELEHRASQTDKDRRLKAYLAGLVIGFQGYDEIGIEKGKEGDDESPRIWKIFVPPACTADRALSPAEMEESQRAQPATTPAVPLLPLLADSKNRRHVLLGDPGMGKSTLIQRLTAGLASGQGTPGAPALDDCIPIPVILRDIVPHLPDDPAAWNWSTLCDTMRLKYQRSEDAPCIYGPWSDLHSLRAELFHSDDAFFLVDGLDEIGDTFKRTAIRDAIWEGFKTYPRARWLVTSRIVGYDLAEVHKDVRVVLARAGVSDHELADRATEYFMPRWGSIYDESVVITARREETATEKYRALAVMPVASLLYLAPFDDGQQDKFVTNWFRERKAPNPPPGLLGDIREREHDGVRVLARVPNLLSYMAILKKDGKPLPDGRAELYMAIARAYLHGIDKAYRLSKKHGHDCPIPFEGRLRLLSILAGEMQHRRAAAAVAREAEEQERRKRRERVEPAEDSADGNIVIAESELRDLLRAPLVRMLPGCAVEKELTDFISFIVSRSGLLLDRGTAPDGGTLFGFTHLSFLEFFAACYVCDELEHENTLIVAAARARKSPDDPAFRAAYLEKYPAGPRTVVSAHLADFAARPEWHEVIIFLAEFFHNSPSERDPILEQLFPFLHSTDAIPVKEIYVDDYPILLPLASAALAIKLARDQHLNLPTSLRHAWFTRLWDLFLAWRMPVWGANSWPVNSLLLDRAAHEADALAALRMVAAGHADLSSLLFDSCLGLTDTSFLAELWPGLAELSLRYCTGLSEVDGLPASLKRLNLDDCTGLSTVAALPASLESLSLYGCTGLDAVDVLPASLEYLNLEGCTGLSAVNTLPTSLKFLYITGCEDVCEVDALPASLTHLYLNDCTGLSALDKLPASLKELHLDGCTGLSALDKLPVSLTELVLNGCTGLSEEAVARVKKAFPHCKFQTR